MAKRPASNPLSISSLVRQGPAPRSSKKLWGGDVETQWVPFFSATNVLGDTAISDTSMGAPIITPIGEDGVPKFNRNGEPVRQVQTEIRRAVSSVQASFFAGLAQFAGEVQRLNQREYVEAVKRYQNAGTLVKEAEDAAIEEELDRRRAAALAELENIAAEEAASKPTTMPELDTLPEHAQEPALVG